MPDRRLRLVLDTDAFNEIDDQFAIAYLRRLAPVLSTEAIYAAPFLNERSCSPEDGMLKSYDEITVVLDALGDTERPPVLHGARRFIGDDGPVSSPAVDDVIARARTAAADDPLHVVVIGAPTNVASALLFEPRIAETIRVVWLGGHAPHWHRNDEFNLRQDVAASRTILDTPAPLLLLPCMGVVSHLTTTLAELERCLDTAVPINRLLVDRFREAVDADPSYARALWDVAAIAALWEPAWIPADRTTSPVLTDDLRWERSPARREIRIARHVDRNAIVADMFDALNRQSQPPARGEAP